MAGQESLGDAVLYLTVNDEALRNGIDNAKAYIRRELGQEISGAVGDGRRRRGRTGAGGGTGGGTGGGAGGDTGGIGPVGTPQARPARPGAGAQRLSSALIGGAFPLLFGQGAGAAIGGGLGGLAGGGQFGFGLSLVGTAIGSAFDEAINKGKELAAALQDPIKNLGALTSSSVLSSRALEKQVSALANSGRAAEAATLAQIDLLDTYGDISDLEALTQAQDEFDRSIAKLQISVASFVSGPLTDFINKLNEGVKKQLEPPTTQPTLLSQGLGLAAGGLAIGAGVAAASGLGLPFSFALLGGSALLAGAAQTTTMPATGNVEENIKEMEQALQLAEKMRNIRNTQKALEETRLALTKQIGDEERNTLEINAVQYKYDLLLAAAGEDKVKQAELELELQEKLAALKDSQARREEARRRKLLADSNKDIDNTLRLFRATLRLREAQQRAANPPRFGESSSAATVRQVEQNVAGARREIASARADLAAAQEKLQNARLFGDAQDIDDASVAVEEAAINLETAGVNLKIAMQEGANTILNNVKSAAEQFRDSIRGLRDLRLGNLRFLPAQQRRDLLREQVRRGIPEARRRGVALRGLSDVINFNRFIEQEQGALQNRDDARRNLVDANNSLRNEVVTQTGALSQLTEVMGRLIDKSWAVYVNVPSQNRAEQLNMVNQLN